MCIQQSLLRYIRYWVTINLGFHGKISVYVFVVQFAMFSGLCQKLEMASVKGTEPRVLNQLDLCSVGMGNFRGQLDVAKIQARVNISKPIETKVNAMVKDYIQSWRKL